MNRRNTWAGTTQSQKSRRRGGPYGTFGGPACNAGPADAAGSDRETNPAMGIWFVSRSDSGF
ncbi:MAG: hypothetical protein DMF91_27800 [Acidobacteria bacterium]|nr:MAG: hypothetical protein DMF91_27800 [Acidobacteriota bacterium]